ncbi:hypothetical protein JCM6882_006033 [Rhodosporidiobolus microsporus]
MVDRAALDARLHAHLATGSHSVCDELLRPLPHSRHSARSSFIGALPAGPGPVWTGGVVVEGVPTPPRSPLEQVAQLCEFVEIGFARSKRRRGGGKEGWRWLLGLLERLKRD